MSAVPIAAQAKSGEALEVALQPPVPSRASEATPSTTDSLADDAESVISSSLSDISLNTSQLRYVPLFCQLSLETGMHAQADQLLRVPV